MEEKKTPALQLQVIQQLVYCLWLWVPMSMWPVGVLVVELSLGIADILMSIALCEIFGFVLDISEINVNCFVWNVLNFVID